jgi:hypothetical protein
MHKTLIKFPGMPTTLTGAIPHSATKDDIYMGYTIPKGAGVMNNVGMPKISTSA